jgi:uncharacterized C2H2 Zn-finger protein
MRCSHCDSLMLPADVVKEGRSEQTLFECPICGLTRLHSRRVSDYESHVNQDHFIAPQHQSATRFSRG